MLRMTLPGMICTLGCLVQTALAGNAPHLTSEQDPRVQDARVVAMAMLAHDERLRSMEWLQDGYFAEPGQRAVDDHDAGWGPRNLFRHGRYGENVSRDWYFFGKIGTRANMETPELEFADSLFTGTEQYEVTFSPETKICIIYQPQHQQRLVASPFACLGRWIDTDGVHRLGELLLAADELVIQDVDPDEELILLRAELTLNHLPAVLLVNVDARRGFVPRSIRRFDAAHNAIQEELVVDRFEYIERHDLWIPTEGIRTLFARAPLNEATVERLDAVTRQIASTHELEPTDLRVRRMASARVFGADGWPVVVMGDGQYSFVVSEIVSINAPFAEEYVRVEVEEDWKVFNQVNGLNMHNATVREIINGFPLVALRRR